MRIRERNPLAPFAHESLTIDNTSGGVGVTSATAFPSNNGSQEALVTIESAQVRFTVDGTAPTTSVGHLADDGDQIMLESPEEVRQFKAIRTGATSATGKVTFFR